MMGKRRAALVRMERVIKRAQAQREKPTKRLLGRNENRLLKRASTNGFSID